jgi:hypothetical protein
VNAQANSLQDLLGMSRWHAGVLDEDEVPPYYGRRHCRLSSHLVIQGGGTCGCAASFTLIDPCGGSAPPLMLDVLLRLSQAQTAARLPGRNFSKSFYGYDNQPPVLYARSLTWPHREFVKSALLILPCVR